MAKIEVQQVDDTRFRVTIPRYFPDYERRIKEMLDQANGVKHG